MTPSGQSDIQRFIAVAEIVSTAGMIYFTRLETIADSAQAAAEQIAATIANGMDGRARRIEIFEDPHSIWQPREIRPWTVEATTSAHS